MVIHDIFVGDVESVDTNIAEVRLSAVDGVRLVLGLAPADVEDTDQLKDDNALVVFTVVNILVGVVIAVAIIVEGVEIVVVVEVVKLVEFDATDVFADVVK